MTKSTSKVININFKSDQARKNYIEGCRKGGQTRGGGGGPRKGTICESYIAVPEGSNIRAIRHDMGLTIEDMALNVGVSVTQLTRWERGEAYPIYTTRQAFNAAVSRQSNIQPVWKYSEARKAELLSDPTVG